MWVITGISPCRFFATNYYSMIGKLIAGFLVRWGWLQLTHDRFGGARRTLKWPGDARGGVKADEHRTVGGIATRVRNEERRGLNETKKRNGGLRRRDGVGR